MHKLALATLFSALVGLSPTLVSVPSNAEELCVGPACVEHHRDRVEERVERRHCKEITVREAGETKHIRKCEEED